MAERPPCKGMGCMINEAMIRMIGASLYWCEGTKPRPGKDYEVCLTNTDADMIRVFMKYLEALGVKKEELKIEIYLYPDHIKSKELKYWSIKLNIDKEKIVVRNASGHGKRKVSHGICKVRIWNKDLMRRVLEDIEKVKKIVDV